MGHSLGVWLSKTLGGINYGVRGKIKQRVVRLSAFIFGGFEGVIDSFGPMGAVLDPNDFG